MHTALALPIALLVALLLPALAHPVTQLEARAPQGPTNFRIFKRTRITPPPSPTTALRTPQKLPGSQTTETTPPFSPPPPPALPRTNTASQSITTASQSLASLSLQPAPVSKIAGGFVAGVEAVHTLLNAPTASADPEVKAAIAWISAVHKALERAYPNPKPGGMAPVAAQAKVASAPAAVLAPGFAPTQPVGLPAIPATWAQKPNDPLVITIKKLAALTEAEMGKRIDVIHHYVEGEINSLALHLSTGPYFRPTEAPAPAMWSLPQLSRT